MLPDGAEELTSQRICKVTGFPDVTVSAGLSENEFAPVTIAAIGPSAAVVEALDEVLE
jgi:hypothetical protein